MEADMARILVRDLRDVDWSSALRFLTREEIPKDIETKAIAAIKSDTERWERQEAEKSREWSRLTKKSRDLLREGRRMGLPDDQVAEAKKVVRSAVEDVVGIRCVRAHRRGGGTEPRYRLAGGDSRPTIRLHLDLRELERSGPDHNAGPQVRRVRLL